MTFAIKKDSEADYIRWFWNRSSDWNSKL